MILASKTFRVFVSSTFSDLKVEREELQKRVFPRLRRLCAENGFQFQAVDLRWGVSDEAGRDQLTMRICLDEIERCQKTGLRPNFIILLGDRYGWRPLPPDIPHQEFEAIEQYISSDARKALLTKWYQRDDNAVPLVYCLQPRSEERANWEEDEPVLHALLLQTAMGILTDDECLKYTASATEQEIVRGALHIADASEHVFAFFRTINDLPHDEGAEDFVDLDQQGQLDREAHQRLQDLKRRLSPPHLCKAHHYEVTWAEINAAHLKDLSFENYDALEPVIKEQVQRFKMYLDTLCDDVYDCIAPILKVQMARFMQIDPLEKEIQEHIAFGEERARIFIGRTDLLQKIKEYVRQGNRHPLVVFGAPGSGKSSLMGYAARQLSNDYADRAIKMVRRFVGATPTSSNIRDLLRSLCQQISIAYGHKDYQPPTEYRELMKAFLECLKYATAEMPLFVFLDALDQLSDVELAGDLAWLPVGLPEHVHLIISTLPGECLSVLEKKLPRTNLLALQVMTLEEGDQLLDCWLKDVRRTLRHWQRNVVLGKFQHCALPLYLKFVFEQVRHWRSYDQHMPDLGTDIPSIIANLFALLSQEAHHGEIMVARSLSYLATAKCGLSEEELRGILSTEEDQMVMKDFRRRALKAPVVDELPMIIWSRLYFDLAPYLTERSTDGMSLMTFYHAQLRDAVVAHYLEGDEQRKRHADLARYFMKQLHLYDTQAFNVRSLSELPYQQTHAQMWSELEQTLCSLEFLHAKIEQGMLYEIFRDYERIDRVLSKPTTSYDDPHKERRTMFRAFSRAFNQEYHAFQEQQHIYMAAQQLYNNLYAHYGHDGRVGEVLKSFVEKRVYPQGHSWLRRLTLAPRTSTAQELIRTLPGHEGAVHALAVPSSGGIIASGGVDGIIRVWQQEDGALKANFFAHKGGVTALAWSIDERWLLSVGRDQSVRIWDWELEREIDSWYISNDRIRSLVVVSDMLLTCGDSRAVTVWQLANKKIVKTLHGHLNRVFCLAVDAHGTLFVSGGEDMTLNVWSADRLEKLRTLRGNLDGVRCVAVDPQGRTAVAGAGKLLKIWNLHTGREIHTLQGHSQRVNCVAIVPGHDTPAYAASTYNSDEQAYLIVSGGDDETIRIWDSHTGTLRRTLYGQVGSINALAIDQQGKWFVSAGQDGLIRIWETIVPNEERKPGLEHEASVTCIVSDLNANKIVSGSDDTTLRIWNRANGTHLHTLRGHQKPVTCLLVPDEKHIVSGSNDTTLKVWDASTGKLLRTLGSPLGDLSNIPEAQQLSHEFRNSGGHHRPITCLAHAGNNLVVTGGKDHTIFLWDILSGRQVRQFRGTTGTIDMAVVSQRVKKVIAAGSAQEVYVWDIEGAGSPALLKGHTSGISCLALLNDHRLITGSRDKTVKLWDLRSSKLLHSFEGHEDWVTCVATDAKTQLIVSGSRDKTVRLWDISSGSTYVILSGHTASLRNVAIEASSSRILSCADDQCMILWDNAGAGEMSRLNLGDLITCMVVLSENSVCLGTRRGACTLLELEGFPRIAVR